MEQDDSLPAFNVVTPSAATDSKGSGILGKYRGGSKAAAVVDEATTAKQLVAAYERKDWTSALPLVQSLCKTTLWSSSPMSDAEFEKQMTRRDALTLVPGFGAALVGILKSGKEDLILHDLQLITNLVRSLFGDRPVIPQEKRLAMFAEADIMPKLLELLQVESTEEKVLRSILGLLWTVMDNASLRDSFVNNGGIEQLAKLLMTYRTYSLRESIIGSLHSCALDERYLDRVAQSAAFEGFISACQALEARLNRRAIIALKAFSTHPECAERLADLRAHEWLVPLLSSSDKMTCFNTACLIIDIREASERTRDMVDRCGALDEAERFFRAFVSMYFPDHTRFRIQNILHAKSLLSVDRHPTVRLCGGWQMLFFCHSIKKVPETKTFLLEDSLLHSITNLCLADDVWLYRVAVDCLRRLDQHFPTFRRQVEDESLSKKTRDWSEEDVAKWVSNQRFGTYSNLFQAAWVDGELLLTMTDVDLEKLGVANPMHRKRILRDIAALNQVVVPSSSTPVSSSSSTVLLPSVPQTQTGYTYDVFISYRRSNGAQLAQLIKVHLRLAGFSVFLDVDELGVGEFNKNLLGKVRASRCFVLLLTANSLDKCMNDPQNKDWVRKEISTALSTGMTIVPVSFEFEWPTSDSLPTDIRAVIGHNAVMWSHEYAEASVERILHFLRTQK